MFKLSLAALAAVAVMGFGGAARAAVVTTYAPVQIDPNHQTVPSPAVVAAGGTNLASSSQSSFQSLVLSSGIAGGTSPDTKPTGAITVLNDASFGSESSASTAFGASSTGSVITLTFTGGYNLTNIVTTSGCGNSYSQYTTQNYSISLRHHGSTNWTTVVSSLQTGNASGGANNYSNFDPNNSCGGVEQWRSVQVTTSFGSGDATNVDAIRFTLLPTPSTSNGDGSGNGKAVWYREIEVTGTAAGSQSGAPTAAFTGTPLSGTNPLPVAFTDTSSGSPTSWAWTFGDGNTSTAQNPSNTYASAGTYDVRLIACNGNGCTTNTKPAYITVTLAPPVANFTATPTNGVASLPVTFSDTSSNSPTSWSWTFGDGSTSTAQNPSHTYATNGTYSVQLVVSNAGGTSTAYKAGYINVTRLGTPDVLSVIDPTAITAEYFNGSVWTSPNYHDPLVPSNMINNSAIYLSSNHSTPATLNTGDPVPATPATVTAEPPGYYSVYGAWMSGDSVAGSVTNSRVTFALGTNYNVSAMLFWNYNPYDVTNRRGIKLAQISYSTDGTNFTSLGQFAFGEVPDNVYAPMETATFSAPVTASYMRINVLQTFAVDAGAPTDYYSGISEVRFVKDTPPGNPPTVNFTGTPTNGAAPLQVAFTDTTLGSPTSWAWTFGDGNTSSAQNPTNTYALTGSYNVRLIACNAYGCATNTKTAYITAIPPAPVASFTATPTNGAAPLQVVFTDTSLNAPTSWAWTFGDGHTSTAHNPTNTYAVAGAYSVQLIACNAYGCSTNTQTAYIVATGATPAAMIVRPTGALATYISGPNAGLENNWDANSTSSNLIDGVALCVGYSDTFTNLNTGDAVPPTPTTVPVAPTGWYGYWDAWMSQPNTITNTVITFDLGQSYSVTSMLLWNYSENGGYGIVTDRGLQTLGISYSTDGTNYTSLGTYLFTQSPANYWTPMQTATFGAPVTARYLQVTPISTFGGTLMGLNEVRFTAAAGASAPTANFSGTPLSGVQPLQVVFTDTSTGSPTSWAWTFGDGNTSTGENPSNTYALAGSYNVQLIACNGNGCSTNTKTAYITVITAQQSWQDHYGVVANSSDPFGKGISNSNQFLAGFSPLSSTAYPHIISEVKSGSDLTITYLGANGDTSYAGGPLARTNVLEYTSGTGNGSYSNNFTSTGQTNILSGGTGLGVVTSFVQTNGATGTKGYYRVRVLAP